MQKPTRPIRYPFIVLLMVVVAAAAFVRVRQTAGMSVSEAEAIADVLALGGWVNLGPNGKATIVDLAGTEVSDLDLTVLFEKFSGLKSIVVCNTRVGDESLQHIVTHSALTSLNLEGTKITDVSLRHISQLNDLEVLTLSGTNISDAGLQEIRGLKNLYLLHIPHTNVTDAGIRSFKTAIPNCLVMTKTIGGRLPAITTSHETQVGMQDM